MRYAIVALIVGVVVGLCLCATEFVTTPTQAERVLARVQEARRLRQAEVSRDYYVQCVGAVLTNPNVAISDARDAMHVSALCANQAYALALIFPDGVPERARAAH